MSLTLKTAAAAAPLFLAESTSSGVRSSLLGELMVQIAALAVIVMVVWNLIDRVRGGQQRREIQSPLTVRKHEEGVGEDEIKQVHGRIARERGEIEAKIADLRAEDLRLRERLDRDIAELHDRITHVPERTIKLLRETKGLI